MEVLFWLLPAAVVTMVAMVVVGWWGRDGRGEVDRETAARRLGEALERDRGKRPGYAVPSRERERSSGIAIRASRSRPVVLPGEPLEPADAESVTVVEPVGEDGDRDHAQDRRAS
ncbi:hypothetical protein ACFQ0K_02560 [Nocardioides caeni]|uniref:hypothetical protein n=1 Tax=Nocardioides caeni TaxID=574700 RepID=UPI001874E8A0|nr:hypothetical protein [Nocardioides caeni]